MDSNTHSTSQPGGQPIDESAGLSTGPPAGRPDWLASLATDVDGLAAQDLDGLSDAIRAEWVLVLRRLVDRPEGQWLKELAGVDARGAAGAEQDQQVGSTAGWLWARLRLGPRTAASAVRTARALFRGPLTATADALTAGAISAAHARAVAHGTKELPDHTAAADPVIVEAARRLDPRQLRRVIGHLRLVVDPEGADQAAQRRHDRRGVWLTPTVDELVAIDGLLEAEAGQIVLAALEPLARPADANDRRSGSQRTADALTELARRALGGGLPVTGGGSPQLTVTVDLDSLLGHPGSLGGDLGGFGPLKPEGCRRLACDGAVTRVLVTRQPGDQQHSTRQPTERHPSHDRVGASTPCGGHHQLDPGPSGQPPPPTHHAGAGHHPEAAIPRPTIPAGMGSWVSGCGPPWPCCPRHGAGLAPSRWMWAGPVGSSPRPNATPWPCGTAAVCSPAAPGRCPGVRAITWCTGWAAAPPTWPTWSWSAERIIGPSMRAAGSWAATPTAA